MTLTTMNSGTVLPFRRRDIRRSRVNRPLMMAGLVLLAILALDAALIAVALPRIGDLNALYASTT